MSVGYNGFALYKANTQDFLEDISYYYDFCNGFKSLDLFAGYGRITNELIKKGVDIEAVELEEEFIQYIDLPDEKKYRCNVLEFTPKKQYDRIFAGFNSFCLINQEEDIYSFFKMLASICSYNGLISLSYYPRNNWDDPSEFEFELNKKKIRYSSDYKISTVDTSQAVWIDHYMIDGDIYNYKFPIKIYKETDDLLKYTKKSGLRLEKIIKNYNQSNISIPGWVEYVFKKN